MQVKLVSYSKPTSEFDNKVENVQDLIELVLE